MTIELNAFREEANTWLRSGLSGLVNAGGVFSSIKQLIGNDKEFNSFISEQFGDGYQRIVPKLIACHATFGNNSLQLPVVPPSVLLAMSWHSSHEEVEQIITNGTTDADGNMIKLQDATTRDVLYYKNKMRAQKELLDEKEIAIRDSRDEVRRLKVKLRIAEQSHDEDETLHLKTTIQSMETQIAKLKKAQSNNVKKEVEKYLLLLDGALHQPLTSEPANYLRISADELTSADKMRLNSLIRRFSHEIEEFKKELGIGE